MNQENKYPNYPAIAGSAIVYFATELAALVTAAEAAGVVITIELEHTDLAMGHYKMVPHVRGARTLAPGSAALRAVAAIGIDPLLLVPPTGTPTKTEDHHYHIDETRIPDLHYWFRENGFTLVTFEQAIDAVYSLRLNPRAFDAFKRSQHAITLPT